MADIRSDLSTFGIALGNVLKEIGEELSEAVEEGLDDAEQLLIEELRAKSPKASGNYAQNWQSKYPKGRYRRVRYVHNPTMVEWDGKEVPLVNILEHSAKHRKPHARKIFNSAKERMTQAILDAVEKARGR